MSELLTVDCGVCWLCGKPAVLHVESEEWREAVIDWRANRFDRPHIQDAFPQLTAGEREMILTGTHEACFDEAFKEDDDE